MRILQIGLGPLGRRTLAEFLQRGLGDVVAAIDPAEELAGKSLDAVLGETSTGARIERDLADVPPDAKVDCALVATRSGLGDCMETFRGLLDRGIDVVSSCEELAYPWLRHPVLAQELHQRALRRGARIVGTGVNPGFLMDALPLVATAVCRDVRAIRVHRIQDASPRRLPFQRKIGAALDRDAFDEAARGGSLRHVGLGESLHFLAHYLGWKLDRWDETLEPVMATRPLECELGSIATGSPSGVEQIARGFRASHEVLTLTFRASIGEPEPHDRVQVDGEPPLDLVLRGGVHGDVATSAILLNCMRALRTAEAGLHTMASLPLVHWRASRDSKA